MFELGIPNRKADEFRHGEDYWNPGKPPKLGFPTPVWGGQMEFPLDFPTGMNFTVGRSQWTKDWNYVLPAAADSTGQYQPCSGTITFDLPQAPASGTQASLYLALAGNDGDKVIVSVNATNLGSAAGVTAVPNAITPAGFAPPYSDTSSIHFSDHGPFCDERINFPAEMLRAGTNTITVTMDSRKMVSFLMLDYLRLELPGYIPPAPSDVTQFAGNNRVLILWSPTPGATSYNILRSTKRDADYRLLATGVLGPVCGSGKGKATFTDTNVVNGTTYFYAIQSLNPVGCSANSSAWRQARHRPPIFAADAPPAPTELTIASSGHHNVALRWNASRGANYYSVWRTSLHEDGIGGTYPIGTILLDDALTNTSYTDNSPTDGRIYSYHVTATSAGGTSDPSVAVTAVPLPDAPASAPASLTGKWTKFRDGTGITLKLVARARRDWLRHLSFVEIR